MVQESKTASRFDYKPIKVLQEGKGIILKEAPISDIDKLYIVSQSDHIRNLQCLHERNIDKSGFLAQRARGA